ncbi:MAG: hypothetical protein AAF492_16185, partial [Verrucomicrobiota bacterium]
SRTLAEALGAEVGDLLYITDTRWWLGGLNSTHALIGAVRENDEKPAIHMGHQTYALVVTPRTEGKPVGVERHY